MNETSRNPPPADVPAKQLWQKLQELPRPVSDPIDFPRKDFAGNTIGKLRIWILDQDEKTEAVSDAEKHVRKRLKDAKATDLGYEEAYANEVVAQMLWRACRDVDDVNRAAWPTPDLLRKITTEECAVLFEHYMTTQRTLGPIVAEMSEGDFEAWVTKLAEGGTQYPLNLLSRDMKDVLLIGMALRLRPSKTDTSSAGSPPDESTQSSNQSTLPAPADEGDKPT